MKQDPRPAESDWMSFPGGELEGRRPKALCLACREARERAASGSNRAAGSGNRLLCFQCYRTDLERNRAFRAAAALNTASEERFQAQLPFETVDKPRLQMLKAARAQARVHGGAHPGGLADRRRRAQMAARRVMQSVIAPDDAREASLASLPDRARAIAAALHAAELQLPESWIPFVVAR
jgi:hypothetical protein